MESAYLNTTLEVWVNFLFKQTYTHDQDLTVHPGQEIEYVVVDNEKNSRERVALAHEEIETYDASYYETQLIRAVESVLSPLGWDRSKIRREVAETRVTELIAFVNSE